MAEPSNSSTCHVVAIPYPGRGHINPMMNLCNLIALRHPSNFLITVVLTQEWLGFIQPEPKPTSNIRFATIPNVIPSEVNRADDFPGFFNATLTKMEEPVEQLLRGMVVPISVVIYDTYLSWVLNMGSRMNFPVASLFTMSATVFTMFYYYHLLVENCNAGDNFSGNMEELVDYIPGVPPTRVADLVTAFNGKGKEVRAATLQAISMSAKAQFLLFLSVYELEAQVIDALKSELSIPIYVIGPAIPYFRLNDMQNDQNAPKYVRWLDWAFWSHCGWNSTKEGAFSGVPMLTFPIFFDQVPNSKMIVEDWKMGRRVSVGEGILVTREEISKLIRSFMYRESEEGKEVRRRAKEVKKICRQAVAEGGPAQIDIDSFISEISKSGVNN
ncbi:putative 7-deoxyloganetin glucosyltransferase [Helianthus debilis subsp. tardiflorus]